MEYRRLGRTDLDVSIIGLGTEHLNGATRETVNSVVKEGIEAGVNYFDLVFSFREYLSNFAFALKDQRDGLLLTGHLGSCQRDGQYYKSRDPKECEENFIEFLSILQIAYVDILFLHNFHGMRDYERAMDERGLIGLGNRLKREGKAHFLGISLHSFDVGVEAVKSERFDVIMAPVNFLGNAVPGRKEFLYLCENYDIGLVAMKTFAGGRLLQGKGTVNVARFRSGGKAIELRMSTYITPVQCIGYSLSQVGVSTVMPGVKNNQELYEAIQYLKATDEERDHTGIIKDFKQYIDGECLYCNHCLPCPSYIDIGRVIRLVDSAEYGNIKELKKDYGDMPVRASACNECAVCVERCPFNVDVIAKIKKAIRLFE